MIDLHTHLLHDVDDGSPNVTVSVDVLRRFEADGGELLVCTPHLDASQIRRAPFEAYAERFQELQAAAPKRPELALGWEIMLDLPGVDLTDPRLGLGGSPAVLVEFPRAQVPREAAAELSRLRRSGVLPILAHPERYWGCTPEQVRSWREAGAAIQMDAAMMVNEGRASRLAHELLAEGLVDCVASDNHGDRRSLASAHSWLSELGAVEQASLLTRTNARRLLDGQSPLPVAPIPGARGRLERLRDIVRGNRG
ncbi:MAG: tyrosine protein phosphatase [Gemmatimonadaceae bacterium]